MASATFPYARKDPTANATKPAIRQRAESAHPHIEHHRADARKHQREPQPRRHRHRQAVDTERRQEHPREPRETESGLRDLERDARQPEHKQEIDHRRGRHRVGDTDQDARLDEVDHDTDPGAHVRVGGGDLRVQDPRPLGRLDGASRPPCSADRRPTWRRGRRTRTARRRRRASPRSGGRGRHGDRGRPTIPGSSRPDRAARRRAPAGRSGPAARSGSPGATAASDAASISSIPAPLARAGTGPTHTSTGTGSSTRRCARATPSWPIVPAESTCSTITARSATACSRCWSR